MIDSFQRDCYASTATGQLRSAAARPRHVSGHGHDAMTRWRAQRLGSPGRLAGRRRPDERTTRSNFANRSPRTGRRGYGSDL